MAYEHFGYPCVYRILKKILFKGAMRKIPIKITCVSSLPLSLELSIVARHRVNNLRLADDETILHKLTNVLTTVGNRDLSDFVRIKPNFLLATFKHSSSKSRKIIKGELKRKRARNLFWSFKET
jgi:hypothetical protein